jgi:hypothetical protein
MQQHSTSIALQPAVTSYASPSGLMEYLVPGKAIVALRTENLLEILMDCKNAPTFDDSAVDDLAEQYTEPRRAHKRRHPFSVALRMKQLHSPKKVKSS